MSNDAPTHECESEIDHYTGHYVPFSLRRVCGFFNVPLIFYYMCKGLWDRAGKTGKSNCLQMLLQRQHFLLSNYLKTLSVGPARVWTYGLPHSRPALIPLSQPGSGLTYYIRHQKSDIWCLIYHITHLTSDIWHTTWDIGHQTSDVWHTSSNTRHQTSNIPHQTSDVCYTTSEITHLI